MHLGCFIWLIVTIYQVIKVRATEISPELQGYENLVTFSPNQLYETCLEENLPNCDVFYYDEIEKRSPKFSSWGGKRAFSSWGGKRAFSSWGGKRAKFSSWGGKRSPQFSSWGGKRDSPLVDDFLNDEYTDEMDKRTKFSNWGGKRISNDIMKRAKFNSWGGKRGTKFSSWAGKRAPGFFEDIKRADSIGYKRKPSFSSWGGKRSNEFVLNDQLENNEEEHSIKKRQVDEEFDGQIPDLWKEFFDRISNPNFNKNNPHEQGKIGTTMSVPVKKSIPLDAKIQRLFKEFVFWTGNQPEEKKNMVMKSRLFKDLNQGTPMRRGNSDFYSWGGKRNESD